MFLGLDKLRHNLSAILMETDGLNNATGAELPQHSLCLTSTREETAALLVKYFIELDPIPCGAMGESW